MIEIIFTRYKTQEEYWWGKMEYDVQLAVYIDANTKTRLDEIKRIDGVAVNAFIRLAIADRLREWDKKHKGAKRHVG